MRLESVRGNIRMVAGRYARSFTNNQAMIAALRALDPETATAAHVSAIIGNGSWTDVQCHECGMSVEIAIELGQEPDHESSTATICRPCLERALDMLDGQS